MMNRRYPKILLIIVYATLVILITFFFSGILINEHYKCNFYQYTFSTYPRLILLAVLFLVGLLFSKLLKVKRGKNFLFTAIVPIFLFFVNGFLFKNELRRNLESNKVIISTAKIYQKTEGMRSHYIRVNFVVEGNIEKRSISLKLRKVKKLNIGDTILLRMVNNCRYIQDVYNLFPSKEELERFSNDRYYKDGKFLDEL